MEGERRDIRVGGKESWQKLGSNFDRISLCLYPSSLLCPPDRIGSELFSQGPQAFLSFSSLGEIEMCLPQFFSFSVLLTFRRYCEDVCVSPFQVL